MVDIRPSRALEFKHTQPPGHNPAIPPLPTSAIMLSQSGSGKSTLILNLLLNPKLYRGCFSRIYLISQSYGLDKTWDELEDYCEKELKVDPKKEKCFFSRASEGVLASILAQWTQIAETMKAKIQAGSMRNSVKGACIILDDFVDDRRAARQSQTIEALAARSRHAFITCIFSVQKFRAVMNTVRMNVRTIYTWRLRSDGDYKALEEEVSGIMSKEEFRRVYEEATREKFSFLTSRLDQPGDMFFKRFDERLSIRRDSQLADRPAHSGAGAQDTPR